ncbi:MAG: hypothetical protein AVDCRST_MAG56-1934 [uncultured Cytophagales bacterium]|uniref:Uncharacterized protein n=1 Tax=uncultured Cytophagales bacterium TaxID=158755 RepID=A0A6J4IIG7_9SPHI|nr:MAG: hypothetical protein AVDCRST_MAG56-1934 [uncultured Cytophagales bacterium]
MGGENRSRRRGRAFPRPKRAFSAKLAHFPVTAGVLPLFLPEKGNHGDTENLA